MEKRRNSKIYTINYNATIEKYDYWNFINRKILDYDRKILYYNKF